MKNKHINIRNLILLSAFAGAFSVLGQSLYSNNFKVHENEDGTYTLSGRGYGHGVGMSQYGAKGMAESGYGYVDILKHYYSGVTIE